MSNVRWFGERLIDRTRQTSMVWMIASTKDLEKFVKKSVNKKYPPASRPLQQPRKRSGTLQKGIKAKWNFESATTYLVTEAPYSLFLEFGTRRMHPRPFMVRNRLVMLNFKLAFGKRRNRPRKF